MKVPHTGEGDLNQDDPEVITINLYSSKRLSLESLNASKQTYNTLNRQE